MNSNLRSWHLDLAGALLLVVLAFVGYQAIYRPIGMRQAQLTALRTELGSQQAKAGQLEETCRSFETRIAQDQRALSAETIQLHSASQLNTRLARITELISAAGMVQHESQTGKAQPGPLYDRIPVSVSGAGTYSQCVAFLRELNGEVPDIGVQSFELSGNPRVASNAASFRFDLVWYAAPGEPSATK